MCFSFDPFPCTSKPAMICILPFSLSLGTIIVAMSMVDENNGENGYYGLG